MDYVAQLVVQGENEKKNTLGSKFCFVESKTSISKSQARFLFDS